MTEAVPAGPKAITAAFLSELIAELRPGTGVRSFEIVRIRDYGDADASGSVSTSTQVSLAVTYTQGTPASLPTRLLAKMSIAEGTATSNPVLDPLFENEIDFYSRLRPELRIETPLGLGGRFDRDSRRFLLLMEDLGPRAPHVNAMSDADNVMVVRALLDTLARLHAQYWESPRFRSDLAWVQDHVQGSIEEMFDGFVREHVVRELAREAFKREFAQELGMSEGEMYHGEKALKRHQARFPRTLLHGDTHFGNTYVMPDGTGGLLDWQVCTHGFLMHDVGYLIQTALSVKQRRRQERELLAYYRDRLCAYGVRNAPDAATLWLEYRRSALHGFYLGWLTAPRENYGWETIVLGNHRTKAACLDLDTRPLILELLEA